MGGKQKRPGLTVCIHDLKNYRSFNFRKVFRLRAPSSHQRHRKFHLYFDGGNERSVWTADFYPQSFYRLSVFICDFFLVGCLSLWLSLFFPALISVDQILVRSHSRGIPGQEQLSLIWCLGTMVLLSSSFIFVSLCASFIFFFYSSPFSEYSISEKQGDGSSAVFLFWIDFSKSCRIAINDLPWFCHMGVSQRQVFISLVKNNTQACLWAMVQV